MRVKKMIACILAVAMTMSLLTVVSAANAKANPNPSHTYLYSDYSTVTLKKSATDDSNWKNRKETTINLSVNSSATPSINKPILLEFVVDSTESLQIYLAYEQLREQGIDRSPISDLKTALTGKNIYIGTTIFSSKGISIPHLGNDKAVELSTVNTNTYYNEIVAKATDEAEDAIVENRAGTNMQAGILAGLENLEMRKNLMISDGNTPIETYLVLIADGGSFYYYENPDDKSTLKGNNNEAANPEHRDNVRSLAELENGVPASTNFERAVLKSSQALDKIGSDTHLITIAFPYYKVIPELSKLTSLANDVMQKAAGKSLYARIFEENTFNVEDAIPTIQEVSEYVANDLANTLFCAIPAGSTITDLIGSGNDNWGTPYDYNVMTGSSFELNFAGEVMTGTLDANNRISFRNSRNIEYAVLQYTPGATENIVLTLKRPLPNGKSLNLSYHAKLSDTVSDGKIHVANTNRIAYLIPQSSEVNASAIPVSEICPACATSFPMPCLSYMREGGVPTPGGGGGHKPDLNKEDHFGYIIGYPVDYETGEWTDDQPRMPIRPEANITRAEVATIYFRMLTDASREELWSRENSFSDVPEDAWYDAAVSTLANGGILTGDPNGKFRPDDPITRAEFATMAVRFFGGTYNGADAFSDIAGHWAENNINLAALNNLINGYPDGTFRPDQKILRCEAITIVNRSLDRHPDMDHFLPDMLKWPDNMDTSKWYYAAMQEATNSHEYKMLGSGDSKYEIWTKMLPIRDWVQFEKEWSDAHSAPNPGEVV